MHGDSHSLADNKNTNSVNKSNVPRQSMYQTPLKRERQSQAYNRVKSGNRSQNNGGDDNKNVMEGFVRHQNEAQSQMSRHTAGDHMMDLTSSSKILTPYKL